MEQKRYKQALQKVDILIRDLGSGARDLNMIRAECLLEVGRIEDCYNLSNAIMRTCKVADVDLLFLRSKCLYRMCDNENCVKHLQQAMRADPDNVAIRKFYRQIRDVEEAKERGNLAYAAGDFESALSAWSQAIELDPTNNKYNSKIFCNKANALSKLKRYDEAVAEATMAIDHDPSNVKAILRRAECNLAIGEERSISEAIRYDMS